MLKKLIGTIVMTIAIVFLLGCLALFIEFMALDGPSIEQGQKRADDIIVALEIHRQGYGKHPTELGQLVPDFLPEIPEPAWRYEYYYEVCPAGVGYVLYFRVGRTDDYCGFSSKTAKWKCTDSVPPYIYDSESPC